MKAVRRILLAVPAVLILAGSARAEFTLVDGWDHQLFPSYLIATATVRAAVQQSEEQDEGEEQEPAQVLGDPHGVLGVKIESPGDEIDVNVTISGDEIMEESSLSCTLDEQGATYLIFPRIKYKYGVLARNKQSVPASVTFEVQIGDEEAETQTETITLRSVNDCPFTIGRADGGFADVSFTFAAYVNEQHPFVDKVLREALNSGIVDSFTGYQSGDPAEVYRQVYAIWNALSDRDVRYSNITTSAAQSKTVYSQHVRLIDESINNSQANCVDGSVLLASLLRKIDIEPTLVFVPGHCYLAFNLDPEGKQVIGLETTLIGSQSDGETVDLPDVDDVVDAEWREKNSWGTFCAAIAMGSADLAENESKFADASDPDYQLIPIAAARRQGILPISFSSADPFESATSNAE